MEIVKARHIGRHRVELQKESSYIWNAIDLDVSHQVCSDFILLTSKQKAEKAFNSYVRKLKSHSKIV